MCDWGFICPAPLHSNVYGLDFNRVGAILALTSEALALSILSVVSDLIPIGSLLSVLLRSTGQSSQYKT